MFIFQTPLRLMLYFQYANKHGKLLLIKMIWKSVLCTDITFQTLGACSQSVGDVFVDLVVSIPKVREFIGSPSNFLHNTYI